MRVAIYVALVVACVAVAPDVTRSALASAAAVLLETLPYAAASSALRPLLGRFAPHVLAYAGCGCSHGAGARSIPAAIACAAVFGPFVAVARWIAAIVVNTLRRNASHAHDRDDAPIVSDLTTLAPAAVLAGVINVAASALSLSHCSAPVQLIAGVTFGFIAAPCALGGVALASALHAQSPLASYAMLGVAGIVDLRVWWRPRTRRAYGDRATYAMLALSCAIVAYQHGASLIHPRLTLVLWGCTVYVLYLAIRSQSVTAPVQRLVAASLVAAVLTGSPPPPEITTEAAIDALYPGERIDFTGEYQTSANGARVVRYGITCCRADARPVCIPLANQLAIHRGAWVNVRGTVRRRGDALVVAASSIRQVAPPIDPFVYL